MLATAIATAGCNALDALLTVEAPDRVAAVDLESPAAASLLATSVRNEFRCTLARYAAASALTGMEWRLGVNSASLVIWEQRRHDTSGFGSQYAQGDCGGSAPALYRPVARTRWLADEVLMKLDSWTVEQVPSKVALTAQTAAFAGYAHLLLGEAFCTVTFDLGPEQPRSVAFERAVERFDRTLAGGSGVPSEILNLARVGKARALLNLDRKAEAAAVAALVPESFSYTLPYSNAENATRNVLFLMNDQANEVTVDPSYRAMAFQGVTDPRVVVRDKGVTGPGTNIRIWTASKYAAAASPIRVASGREAQLIMAEAAVAAGNVQAAVDIINRIHVAIGLPSFESASATETMAQIIYERRAELFLEGHHLFDITRLNLPLDPPSGTPMEFGGSYGEQLCFQLPATEFLNNPSFSGVGAR